MNTTSTGSTGTNGSITLTIPLTLVIGLGTGGLWFTHSQAGTGGSINPRSLFEMARAQTGARALEDAASTADDIDYIKHHLNLSTTDLAKYLGVSRQAIYDWRSGAHVKSHNITKLENLRDAAGILDTSSLSLSSLQLNRKLPGGRTLLETIAAGGNGYEAAQSLVSLLRRETEQRRGRMARTVGRQPIADSDFSPGMAAVHESG